MSHENVALDSSSNVSVLANAVGNLSDEITPHGKGIEVDVWGEVDFEIAEKTPGGIITRKGRMIPARSGRKLTCNTGYFYVKRMGSVDGYVHISFTTV